VPLGTLANDAMLMPNTRGHAMQQIHRRFLEQLLLNAERDWMRRNKIKQADLFPKLAPLHNEHLPPAARVIDYALHILGPNGGYWAQEFEKLGQRRCIVGALRYVSRKYKLHRTGAADFVRAAIRRTDRRFTTIMGFNDSVDTNFSSVREVMLIAKCDAMRAARLKSAARRAKQPVAV
jgi:hypothetical protein